MSKSQENNLKIYEKSHYFGINNNDDIEPYAIFDYSLRLYIMNNSKTYDRNI